MSLAKDHPFLPQEPCRVFLTELELKGNLAFCWRGAGLGGTSHTGTLLQGRKQCRGEALGQSCRTIILCLLQMPDLLKLQNILTY